MKTLLRYSPSSINSQPWHFILAASDAAKQRIAKATQQGPYGANAPKVLTASHVIVFCARTSMDDAHIPALMDQEEQDGCFPTPKTREGQRKGRNF